MSQIEELLRDGLLALKAGDRAQAYKLLAQAVRVEPKNERAWLYLAGAVSDPQQRKTCLERVIQINPQNTAAQRGLQALGVAPSFAPQPAPVQAQVAAPTPQPRPATATTIIAEPAHAPVAQPAPLPAATHSTIVVPPAATPALGPATRTTIAMPPLATPPAVQTPAAAPAGRTTTGFIAQPVAAPPASAQAKTNQPNSIDSILSALNSQPSAATPPPAPAASTLPPIPWPMAPDEPHAAMQPLPSNLPGQKQKAQPKPVDRLVWGLVLCLGLILMLSSGAYILAAIL